MPSDDSGSSGKAPQETTSSRPRRPEDDDNPFIAFRRYADSYISSILQSVVGLPSVFTPLDEHKKWKVVDEEMEKLLKERDRRLGLDEPATRKVSDRTAAGQVEDAEVARPYRNVGQDWGTFEEKSGQSKPSEDTEKKTEQCKTSEKQKSWWNGFGFGWDGKMRLQKELRDTSTSTPTQDSVDGGPFTGSKTAVEWLLKDPYSPLQLEMAYQEIHPNEEWRDAFSDLLHLSRFGLLTSGKDDKPSKRPMDWIASQVFQGHLGNAWGGRAQHLPRGKLWLLHSSGIRYDVTDELSPARLAKWSHLLNKKTGHKLRVEPMTQEGDDASVSQLLQEEIKAEEGVHVTDTEVLYNGPKDEDDAFDLDDDDEDDGERYGYLDSTDKIHGEDDEDDDDDAEEAEDRTLHDNLGSDFDRNPSLIHFGIFCDGQHCPNGGHDTSIRGLRYHCHDCWDTDFCADCVATHREDHDIEVVGVRSSLWKSLYSLVTELRNKGVNADDTILDWVDDMCYDNRPTRVLEFLLGQEVPTFERLFWVPESLTDKDRATLERLRNRIEELCQEVHSGFAKHTSDPSTDSQTSSEPDEQELAEDDLYQALFNSDSTVNSSTEKPSDLRPIEVVPEPSDDYLGPVKHVEPTFWARLLGKDKCDNPASTRAVPEGVANLIHYGVFCDGKDCRNGGYGNFIRGLRFQCPACGHCDYCVDCAISHGAKTEHPWERMQRIEPHVAIDDLINYGNVQEKRMHESALELVGWRSSLLGLRQILESLSGDLDHDRAVLQRLWEGSVKLDDPRLEHDLRKRILEAVQYRDELYKESHPEAPEKTSARPEQDKAQDSTPLTKTSEASTQTSRPPAGEAPSILSILTTTERRTLPDGSVQTKIVLKKRFSDGTEDSSETVHNSSSGNTPDSSKTKPDAPGSRTEEPKPKEEKNKKKKGWFWSS